MSDRKPSGDYVSPGLTLVGPDEHFPNMVVGNTDDCHWPYLRREIPHNWYVDRRQPFIGFLSRDEASILYNSALQFAGKPALEIGCWMGWSACHLALAGVDLDVIDPILGLPDARASIEASLGSAGVLAHVCLVAGHSPTAVEELAREGKHWSLIFIDGDHEGDAPWLDARACEPYAADDAMILFHDLASPYVAKGLDYLSERGWHTRVYQTMQIMGVAWRGNVSPVDHVPDPTVTWQLPEHLRQYSVSGIPDSEALTEFRDLLQCVRHYTLLSESRLFSLYSLALQVCESDLPGNFVECGAYKGGATALLAAIVQRHTKRPRRVFTFDTFAGMPEPNEVDRSNGTPANDTGFGMGTLKAPIAENLAVICKQLGVTDIVTAVPGLFADTLPRHREDIGEIALLHADGKCYSSTIDIFENLYDSVVPDGVIQIDDYGHWEGCQKAVRDFERHRGEYFDLQPIDYTGVWFRKPLPLNAPLRPSWGTALPEGTLRAIQQGSMNYTYRGVSTFKNPFDFALYPMLLWNLKPGTILEIGSANGGSALWLADLLETFGIDAHIYSIDIRPVTQLNHPRVTFLGGNQLNLGDVLSTDFLANLPRPLLVIEDGAHFYETTLAVLEFFYQHLHAGEYIVIEDGIVSDLGENTLYRGGPNRAIREFLVSHPGEYEIDAGYCDFFGCNVTWNTNGYLRKIGSASDVWLQSLDLREANFVAFPDWSQPEESLFADLKDLLGAILQHHDRDRIALFLGASATDAARADELLSEATMAVLLESEDADEREPAIALLTEMTEAKWHVLLPKLWGRVRGDFEATACAAPIQELPVYSPAMLLAMAINRLKH